jgi:uncharacterized iron-regulated membrane protein
MKSTLRKIHRYVSLALAAVWLVQALTGVLMVFHWELDDAMVAGEHRPVEPLGVAAAAQRVQRERPESTVVAFYATAGAADRFDIYLDNPQGTTDIVRVDGSGQTLMARPLDYDYRRAGLIQAAIVLHQTLFAGDGGKLFLGFSAFILLTNIIMGLTLAWPRRAEWRRALLPTTSRVRIANLFSWHRAVGLWLAIPAMVLIFAGMLSAFEEPLDHFLGTGEPPAVLADIHSTRVHSLATATVAPAVAMQIALQQFPAATPTSMRMPRQNAPWYEVWMKQPGEARRVYGQTAVYVSAEDGHFITISDALKASWTQRFVFALVPTHTGEIAGLPGRLLAMAVGVWLLTMLVLGVTLWSGRRRSRSVSSPAV